MWRAHDPTDGPRDADDHRAQARGLPGTAYGASGVAAALPGQPKLPYGGTVPAEPGLVQSANQLGTASGTALPGGVLSGNGTWRASLAGPHRAMLVQKIEAELRDSANAMVAGNPQQQAEQIENAIYLRAETKDNYYDLLAQEIYRLQKLRAQTAAAGDGSTARRRGPLWTAKGLRDSLKPVHDRLYDHPCAAIFRAPVNPIEVPDYLSIIQHPMDLGTIRERLNSKYYKEPVAYCDDVRLVFQNAWTYNKRNSAVYKHAMEVWLRRARRRDRGARTRACMTRSATR